MALVKLRNFVEKLTAEIEKDQAENVLLEAAGSLLKTLISTDDWLPEQCAKSHPDHFQQYLLYCDELSRISVISFVLAPGQSTPVHDHTVWGIVGSLRGMEYSQPYAFDERSILKGGEKVSLNPGDIELVSPSIGDIHKVSNGLHDQDSISIHVYGANIGKVNRHAYNLETGETRSFVSGYANPRAPDIRKSVQ